jgi:hypothetical protein
MGKREVQNGGNMAGVRKGDGEEGRGLSGKLEK